MLARRGASSRSSQTTLEPEDRIGGEPVTGRQASLGGTRPTPALSNDLECDACVTDSSDGASRMHLRLRSISANLTIVSQILVVALIAFAPSTVGAGFGHRSGSLDQLLGAWTGDVHQGGLTSPSIMTVDPSAQGIMGGKLDYPSLPCGGEHALLSEDGSQAGSGVDVNHGSRRCVDGGSIQFSHRSADAAQWVLHHPDGDQGAAGTLQRVAKSRAIEFEVRSATDGSSGEAPADAFQQGRRIAFSERAGVEVFAEESGGDWCREQVSLRVLAKDEAFFSGPGFQRLVRQVGTRVLASECAAAQRAALTGVARSSKKTLFSGHAAKSEDWLIVSKAGMATEDAGTAIQRPRMGPPSMAPPAELSATPPPAPSAAPAVTSTTRRLDSGQSPWETPFGKPSRVEATLNVSRDGTGTWKTEITVDPDFVSEFGPVLNRELETDIPKATGIHEETILEGGKRMFTVLLALPNVALPGDRRATYEFREEPAGLFRSKYLLSFGFVKDFTWPLSLEAVLPGSIEDTNGHETSDAKVRWESEAVKPGERTFWFAQSVGLSLTGITQGSNLGGVSWLSPERAVLGSILLLMLAALAIGLQRSKWTAGVIGRGQGRQRLSGIQGHANEASQRVATAAVDRATKNSADDSMSAALEERILPQLAEVRLRLERTIRILDADASAAPARTCPRCGSRVGSTDAFCAKCGTRLQQDGGVRNPS